ncbi:alpha/beta hydrolase family protein [Nonomuraea sp. NPDC049400]|uniref:alpha/beta hydrolase family protein n=1 Tax=Nonomuraea sp. NPDC049400 TaxID=3364352 RepID=UPI0037BD3F64
MAASVMLMMPAAALAAPPARISLPEPTGARPVGSVTLHLVDRDRADPWRKDRRRELMVTVTYPARATGRHERAAWLPDGVAAAVHTFMKLPENSVAWDRTKRHAYDSAAVDRRGGPKPVVLFSPGLNVPRELDTVLTDDLASRGYVVVSISHTYETLAVQFPGDRVERMLPADLTPAYAEKATETRVADTRFVLDRLAALNAGTNPDAERRPLPSGLSGALDLGQVGMFGHSLGGFTAGEAMYRDRRIDAGVNMDGGMAYGDPTGTDYRPGKVAEHGLDRPFMLMGSAPVNKETGELNEHNHLPGGPDRSWRDFWSHQRGWKRDLTLLKAAHNSFTDLQTVVPQLGALIPEQDGVIGTIDPGRSLAAQRTYLASFFDLHLRHRNNHLLDGPSPKYPEIKFVK